MTITMKLVKLAAFLVLATIAALGVGLVATGLTMMVSTDAVANIVGSMVFWFTLPAIVCSGKPVSR